MENEKGMTCFEHSRTRNMNYGSFQTLIFNAYNKADSENAKRLEMAFPEWFTIKKENW